MLDRLAISTMAPQISSAGVPALKFVETHLANTHDFRFLCLGEDHIDDSPVRWFAASLLQAPLGFSVLALELDSRCDDLLHEFWTGQKSAEECASLLPGLSFTTESGEPCPAFVEILNTAKLQSLRILLINENIDNVANRDQFMSDKLMAVDPNDRCLAILGFRHLYRRQVPTAPATCAELVSAKVPPPRMLSLNQLPGLRLSRDNLLVAPTSSLPLSSTTVLREARCDFGSCDHLDQDTRDCQRSRIKNRRLCGLNVQPPAFEWTSLVEGAACMNLATIDVPLSAFDNVICNPWT